MLKRGVDIACAAIGLLMLSPLLLGVALWIKLDSPGPVFFRQVRVGRHGRHFRIFKFRTMTHVAAPAGPELTVAGDARITRSGALLRKYKIDELPQLVDVLRGTMSLVGPRPEVPRYVAHYPPDFKARVLSVRPGITDLASVRFRNENDLLAQAEDPEREYLEVILPSKLQYAVDYVDNASLVSDLRLLGLTLKTVFVPPSTGRFFAMPTSRFWQVIDEALSSPHRWRTVMATAVDGVTVLSCWHITYLFRLGFERWQPGRPWYDDLVSLAVVAVYLVCLASFGARRGIWRFFGFEDLKRITLACAVAGLVSAVGVLMAQLVGVARAVLLLHPLFTLIALAMLRMVYRTVWEHARSLHRGEAETPKRAIVLGAGDAARRLVAGIHLREGWTVQAILDDSEGKIGTRINGIPVEGPLVEVRAACLRHGATHVIVAMPGATRESRATALLLAKSVMLPVLVVPGQDELQTPMAV
ncbi:sugar transferase [Rhizobacter sp. LjRoot28]|uniref:sugar transferase n=1 Tax=Rhizobacter sp. LjRoot28 TaxID=3342309 RepID=UPI003F5093E5